MSILHDFRHAWRTLGAAPGRAMTVIVPLAFSLAANLTIFSWLDALAYRPLGAVPRQDELVVIDGRAVSGRDQRLSYPDVRDLAASLRQVTGLTAYTFQPFTMATGDHAERVWGQLVTANFFEILGAHTVLGRGFRSDEEAEGAGPVVVISDRLWNERFNRDPSAIGRAIEVNSHRMTIVGIAPPQFNGVAPGLLLDVWIPIGMQPTLAAGGPNRLHDRGLRWLGAYARLAPGTAVESLRGELSGAAAQLASANPSTNTGTAFTANHLSNAPWGGTNAVRPVLTILLTLVALLLVATCANVATLLVARAAERRREIAARLSLGASRWLIVRQVFVESATVGVIAAALAVVAAASSARLFTAFLPPTGFPIGFAIAIDGRLLLAACVATAIIVTLIGVAPAMHSANLAIANVLREESGAITAGVKRARLRVALMSAQVAIALVLLVTAGALAQTLSTITTASPGFDTERVLLAALDFGQAGYTPARAIDLLRRLAADLNAVPGVRSASFAQRIPLDFGGRGLVPVGIDGYIPRPGEEVVLTANHVGPAYFHTMQIPVIDGRDFAPTDDASSEAVAIVTASAAKKYWKDGSAINKQIVVDRVRRRVIAVAGDIRQDGLNLPAAPALFVPLFQAYRPSTVLHVSATTDPGAIAGAVRGVLQRIDPALPLYDVRTMREHMGVPAFPFRLGATLAAVLGAMALLLTVVGLYGVGTHAIVQQRRELGVRLALGATRSQLVWLLSRQGLITLVIGSVAGVAMATMIGGALQRRIPDWQFVNWTVYAVVFAFIAAICCLATLAPARRMMTMDPASALKP